LLAAWRWGSASFLTVTLGYQIGNEAETAVRLLIRLTEAQDRYEFTPHLRQLQ